MTKKDYELIASVLKFEYKGYAPGFERQAIRIVIVGLAEVFGNENPRFNRLRFLEACGMDKYAINN